MKLIGKLLKVCFLLVLAFVIFALVYYFAATKDTQLVPEKLLLTEDSVRIYDYLGTPIKNTNTDGAPTVSYEKIPSCTVQAFVNVEDKHFFTHNGFDGKRIAKAVLLNAKAGKFKQGASTISQQLVKNTHLSQEKTLKRKLQEWKLTRALEKRYTKEEILEKYLNVIYFGHNCFGLRSASNFYFGKEPEALDLADSAILAGLVKSPNN